MKCCCTVKMKCHCSSVTVVSFLQSVKVLSLAICSAFFMAKVSECYLKMLDYETGTNIEIKSMARIEELPAFSICRLPSQVFNLWDGQGNNLEKEFGLQVHNMTSLMAFKLIEDKGKTFEDVFLRYSAPAEFKQSASVGARGDFLGEEKILTSPPFDKEGRWSEMYHPLYGACSVFHQKKRVDAGVNFIRIYANMIKSFPQWGNKVPENHALLSLRQKRESPTRELQLPRPPPPKLPRPPRLPKPPPLSISMDKVLSAHQRNHPPKIAHGMNIAEINSGGVQRKPTKPRILHTMNVNFVDKVIDFPPVTGRMIILPKPTQRPSHMSVSEVMDAQPPPPKLPRLPKPPPIVPVSVDEVLSAHQRPPPPYIPPETPQEMNIAEITSGGIQPKKPDIVHTMKKNDKFIDDYPYVTMIMLPEPTDKPSHMSAGEILEMQPPPHYELKEPEVFQVGEIAASPPRHYRPDQTHVRKIEIPELVILHDRQNAPNYGKLFISAFQAGSFHTSKEALLLTQKAHEVYSLSLEVTNKTGVAKVAGCEPSMEYNEDLDCLNKCIVRRFVDDMKCVHPRLIPLQEALPNSEKELRNTRICMLSDMEPRAKRSLDDDLTMLDPGFVLLKDITSSLDRPDNATLRCGCKLPCTRLHLRTQRWSQKPAEFSNTDVYTFLHFPPHFKTYSYHMLYTASDLFSDIGGYLGLFLGMSVFGLVELLQTMALEKTEKKKKLLEAQDMEEEEKDEKETPLV